jgi:hypothetical protein
VWAIHESETVRSPRPGVRCLLRTPIFNGSPVARICLLSVSYVTMAGRIGCDRRYSSPRPTTSLLPPRETSTVQIRLSPTSTHYAAAATPCSIDEPPGSKWVIAEAETARSPRPGIDCLAPTSNSRRPSIVCIITLSKTYMAPAGQVACDRRAKARRSWTIDDARYRPVTSANRTRFVYRPPPRTMRRRRPRVR